MWAEIKGGAPLYLSRWFSFRYLPHQFADAIKGAPFLTSCGPCRWRGPLCRGRAPELPLGELPRTAPFFSVASCRFFAAASSRGSISSAISSPVSRPRASRAAATASTCGQFASRVRRHSATAYERLVRLIRRETGGGFERHLFVNGRAPGRGWADPPFGHRPAKLVTPGGRRSVRAMRARVRSDSTMRTGNPLPARRRRDRLRGKRSP